MAKSKVPKNPHIRPLRIGIDTRLAYRRGVGTYAANLVKALSKVDKRNEYFLFNAPDRLKDQVSNRRFHWESLPFSNAGYYEQVLLPRAANKRELDFLHYVDNSATVLDDIPFVLTLHDTMYQRPLSAVRAKPTLRQRLVHRYKQWAVERTAPLAKAVLTVSDFSKGEILKHVAVLKEKVFVTPEGVDLKEFNRVPKKPSKLFRILAHGAADERKNMSNILKAAKELVDQGKKFQLVVIGMDQRELQWTHYVRQVTDLGLGPYVDWVGSVPFEMLRSVYAEADLFLYPSRLEGFGLPVLEAFACGVPVITSNTTSLPEVAGKAALLVDPENPQAIALAVRRMMEKPALRKQFIQRGFGRAKLFTWEKTARATLKVYEEIKDLG